MLKSGLFCLLIPFVYAGAIANTTPLITPISTPNAQAYLIGRALAPGAFTPVTADLQPTRSQIDAAANEAQTQGRIIPITPGGMTIPAALQEVASLPVTFRSTIGNWNYDITVLSMSFTPTGSVLSIGCRFYLPGSTPNTALYFGANDITVSGKSGFSGDLPILESLLSDEKSSELDDPTGKLGGQTKFFEFPLPAFQGKAWMGLGKDSKLSFACGEFKKFSLTGFVKVYELVKREDPAGQSLTDGRPLQFAWTSQDVFDWQDIYFPVTASRGFHSANATDIGFHPTDKTKVILDLSQYQSPASLPDCGGGNLGNSWQGIQFDAFAIRLPKLFKLRQPRTLQGQGTNLFLSPTGVIGTVSAQQVFTLEEGYTDEINKFDLSLDQVTANFSCGASANLSLSGRLRLGTCGTGTDKASELYYNVVYTEQDRHYQVLVKENATDRFRNNGLTLSTGSTLSLSIQNESFVFQTALAARPRLSTPAYHNSICLNYPTTLTVSNCESITRNWSTGEIDKNTVTINPQTQTTYTVNCVDKYCISESSNELAITVYSSLPQPTLTATSPAFCTYQNATLSADNCVGKLEWQTPDNTTFRELSTNRQTAYFPGQSATATFVYQVRCNLNTCLSPPKDLSLTVYPEPKAPSLWSSATSNTIDRNESVTLGGSCTDNNRLVWENLPETKVQLAASTSYQAICKNPETGCQTQSPSRIDITVLYFPPAAPSPVSFGAVGTNYITVNWRDNSGNEDGFWIDRSTSSEFTNSVRIGDVGANTTSFLDQNLSEGVTYYYRVISHNRYDNGYSEIAFRSTGITPIKPVCNPPVAPSISATNISINEGKSGTLSVNGCSGGAILWNTGSQEASISVNKAGYYTVSCTVSNDCGSSSSSTGATVTINNKPPCDLPPTPSISVSAITITAGESGILTVEGCSGGDVLWNTGATTTDITVNQSGNYSVSCTRTNECGQSSSTTGGQVTVISKPCTQPTAPTIQVADVTISANESTGTLTVVGCAGTIKWTTGSQTASITVPPGYYSVTCTVFDQTQTCSNSNTTGGWVRQSTSPCNATKPSVMASQGTINKKESVKLTASSCSVGDLEWQDDFDNSQPERTLTPDQSTTYRVRCWVSDTCQSEWAEVTITVKQPCNPPPKPVITGPNEVEKGKLLSLEATGCDDCDTKWSTYDRWVWPTGQPTPRPAPNVIYTSIKADKTFTVSFSKDGCEGPVATKTVTVIIEKTPSFPPNTPIITVSQTTICTLKGSSSILTVANCNGTLSWSTGETTASITVYEAKKYTAYCATIGYSAVSTDILIKNSTPSISITRIGKYFNAEQTGCTTEIKWFKEWVGPKIQLPSGSSVDTSYYGFGRYEARCGNSCGEVYAVDYVTP